MLTPPRADARPRPDRRIEGLDLLRGVAVGLVLLRHAWPTAFPGAGVVGVVLFFVLSGFLITGSLVDQVRSTGRLDALGFYARRARRLVPALVVAVAGFVAVTLVLDPLGGDRDQVPASVLWALTWTGDLPFGHASPATFHLWTLAVEEQFYLFWPLLLAPAVRRGRVGLLLVVSGAVCALGAVLTTGWLREAPELAYPLPTSWAGCLLIGAALATVARLQRPPSWAMPLAAAGLTALCLVPLRGHAATYLVAAPVIALLSAVLVRAAAQQPRLSMRPSQLLARLGVISYGIYLWDYPLALWLRPHDPTGLAAPLLAIVLAGLSWRYVERPVLQGAWRRRSGGADQPVLVRDDHDLDPVAQLQLAQDATHVGLDGGLTGEHLGSDLSVRPATGN